MVETIASGPLLALGLVVTFLVGYFEAAALNLRGWACVTWFYGLVIAVGWVARPRTPLRICLGTGIFAVGLALMVVYYRRRSVPRA